FPASSERTLNVGWATVSRAVLELLQVDATKLGTEVVRGGEIGEALAALWPARGIEGAGLAVAAAADGVPGLTLAAVDAAFDALAEARSNGQRELLLREVFSRCIDPREACYLAKII